MVVVRRALPSVLLLASLLASLPASAQEPPAFLLLGTDATGDAVFQGETWPDTWVDINSFSIATVGTDLVFHMGLEGTTTEAGQYCWMAAFQVGEEEYIGLDCYEGLAYESDNTLSQAYPPASSRGTNVASDVSFVADGVVITVPLDAIGASVGTVIDDIYGLTYVSRRLYAADTVPDAKMDVAAEESLGSYIVGGAGAPVTTDIVVAARNVTENLTTPGFLHEFANATSDDYTLNFTVAWPNATLLPTASVSQGSANVTVRNNGTVVYSRVFTNQTHPALQGNATAGNATAGNATAGNATAGNATGNTTLPTAGNATANATAPLVIGNATGNWTVTIDYEGFVGTLGLNVTEYVPPAPVAVAEAKAKDSPGPGLPMLALAVTGLAVALRRRRSA